MKAIKFFVTALIAALVLGCYVSVYADSLDVTEKRVTLSSRVIGKYPQISGMDSLNDEIKKFITQVVIELTNRDGIFQQVSSDKILDYSIEYNGDYAKLQLSVNKPLGIILKATDKKYYYIDTITKSLTTEDVYNAEPETEEEAESDEEPSNDGPIELSSIYYYRLRDIADYLGYELEFHPAEDELPSSADIIYVYYEGDNSFSIVIATVFSGSSLVLCDDIFFDMEYPVEHLDNYIYIPSTLVQWLIDILYYTE